jgi:hypothetical protein
MPASTSGEPPDRHGTLVANDNRPLAPDDRDRLILLLCLHRRLEEIYPSSAEAVDIRALIDKLSYPTANRG